MDQRKARKIGIRILKILGWTITGIIALLLLVMIAIQIPWVQNKIRNEAISFLESKIGTPVQLAHFSLSFPKKIVIEGLYIEDQAKDTLLYAGRIGIDTDLWALTDNTIELNKIELSNIVSTIKRSEADSAFNFDYIIAAFATEDTTAVDTTAAPWTFRLGAVDLDRLSFYLNDSISGNRVDLKLRTFTIDTELFDLDSGAIRFDEIFLAGLSADVLQFRMPEAVPDSAEVVPEDSAAVGLNISFNRIRLNEIDAEYNQKPSGQVVVATLKDAVIEADTIDIKKQIIDLTRVALTDPFISVQMTGKEPTYEPVDPVVAQHNEAQEPWRFSLDHFVLHGGRIQYFDHLKPAQEHGIDFAHTVLSNLNIRLNGLRYIDGQAFGTINEFSFREKSGFHLEALHGSLAMFSDSLAISDFGIRTGHSDIAVEVFATYPSIETLTETPASASGVIDLASSTISLRDLLYISPTALDSVPLSLPESSVIQMGGRFTGTMEDVTIDHFQMHAMENTSLFINGRLTNVSDTEKMHVAMNIDKFYTTAADIQMLLVDSLIPSSMQLPEWLSLRGNYRGTMSTPNVDAELTSELGNVYLDARLDLNKSTKENYRGEIRIVDFFLGKLLGQPEQIGKLDMVATVNGAGTTMEELDGIFKVRVNSFGYNGYSYRDFRLNGTMKKYFFSGEAELSDENLDFTLAGDLDYDNEVPRYKLALDLRNADFEKLGFSAGPMRARALLDVDLETPDFQKINGDVGIRNFAIFNGTDLYSVDSLLFASIDQEGRSEISIRSDILTGDFKGTINIFTLPDVLSRHFNKYFSLNDTTYSQPVGDQRFSFDLVLKNTDLITEVLVPELEPFVPGKIRGEYNSASDELRLDFFLSEINYAGIALDTISLRAISDSRSFDMTLNLKDILIDTLNIKALRLAANVMNDSIRTNFSILDSAEQEKYYLGGVFYSLEDAFRFSFLQNQVTLNYQDWQTPLYNTLAFSRYGLEPNNFYIAHENERILLYKKNTADSTLSIAFRDVELSNLTSLVEGTTPIAGIIDGELTLASSVAGSFETQLQVKDLAILEQTWGNLRLGVNKKPAGPMNFALDLRGQDADLDARGFLSQGANPEILLEAQLKRLNLSIVEPLTMGQLQNLKGMLTADFTMRGPTADADLSGRVNFRDASFFSTFAKTSFTVENESIYLRDEEIVFDKFDLLDANKNKATLDGLVAFRDQGGFNLKLNLKANEFQLLNTSAGDNEMFYGNIRINTTTTITGTSLAPKVNMSVGLADGSELTYIVPQSESGVLEQKGIVVFVDKDAQKDPFMRSIDLRDTVEAGFTGVDLTANIQLTGNERFNVVIDPVTGDQLSVRGASTLTLQMDPTGDMQLTGRYEIVEGSYDLSFAKFVKRSFSIERGSTMTWSGEVLNAQMNIRAMYQLETQPIDLVANQVPEEELNSYKKAVPVNVFLIIKGELLSPEISFELGMPENARDEFGGSLYARLLDINTRESDLNKQVFALLVLKRFISENPFESQAGGSFAGSARKSVSKILSDQLNRLSSNVKGVELSFDLKSYEDYSSGAATNTTDLELGVSKSLLNDRLVVKVSGNVNLEGEDTGQDSFTDFIGDLALEYKLTEDGRLRVTGFRNNTYDMINGDIIETGAGLIYIKDYDALSELFRANEKKKANDKGNKDE